MTSITDKTLSLCPICVKDSPSHYEETPEGMLLHVECPEHGASVEKVENDSEFFKYGYEQEYKRRVKHLALPITYRCNLSCIYCYTLSNSSGHLPEDKTLEWLLEVIKDFDGNITLIGGEPTVRDDLTDLIIGAKEVMNSRKLSLGTNGQRLKDLDFAAKLKDSGLDFVFLSLNDICYEESASIYNNKIKALDNCLKLNIPVWLQRTIDDLSQIDSIFDIVEKYSSVVFNLTLRAVKPFGTYYPKSQIYTSDIAKYLDNESSAMKGTTPFNRHVYIKGKRTKICSWVNDMVRLDPIDSNYLISDGTLTTFHRGMKLDENLLLQAKSAKSAI